MEMIVAGRTWPPARVPAVSLMLALAAMMGLAGAACRSESTHALLAPATPPPLVIRPEHATQPDELGNIVHMAAREVATRLGSFRADEHSSLKVDLGGNTVETLDEIVLFEADGKGSWHGVRENSHEQGIEAWAEGEALTVKMRYGKPVRRRPEGDEVDRLREDLFGDTAAYYDLVERYVEASDGGRTEAAGRPVRRVQLSLRRSPRSAGTAAAGPSRRWRDGVRVDALEGQLMVDAKSGAPLTMELAARASYPRGSGEAQLSLQISRRLRDLGAAIEIGPPADAMPAPARPRYEVDKRELLEGLAADRSGGRR
jgi:hypothetical protein